VAGSAEVISHWHHSVENLTASALEFYRAVEDTLTSKESPTKIDRIDWRESGVLSAKREYLRVCYGRYAFEICAAPFGKDYFFSWWLTKRNPDMALLYGCGAVIGLIVLYGILVKVAGLVGGTLLFLIALAAAFGLLMNAARAGAAIVEDVILATPIMGMLYSRFLKPVTYYTEDTRLAFEEAVHRVVLQHVEALLNAKGAKALAPEETKSQSRPALR
jgi:hypothetical protein